MKCMNVMQCKSKKKKKKQQQQQQQRRMVTKNREIKHNDHDKKTQLDRAFCIQNFLNATFTLELLFILECRVTPGLE